MPDEPIEDKAQQKIVRLGKMRDDAVRMIAAVATLEGMAENFTCDGCKEHTVSIAKVVRQEMYRVIWDYEQELGATPDLPPNASGGQDPTDQPPPGVDGS